MSTTITKPTATRLALYGAVLVASLAAAAWLGSAVGPIDTGTASAPHHSGPDDPPDPAIAMSAFGGVSLDAEGYRVTSMPSSVPADEPSPYSFRIIDSAGQAFVDFEVLHERELHMIVASRDLDGYVHLHPERSDDGTWTITLPAMSAGSYRVFLDVQPAGRDAATLGVDLAVTDDPTAGDPPPAVTHWSGDGFDVTISGTPEVGSATLTFAVERDGDSIETEPYLGAAGHLVAFRAGDLAYLHVHAAESGMSSDVAFVANFPTPGTYRLFFDFSVDGAVHTAAFTIDLDDPVTVDVEPEVPTNTEHPEGH